ncbi:unnamed protein product [Linum trigynum]|uniref:Uncharacterized protein n=1 Tax=Linum trigynum TaxID=586398 RepID=A0AAV2DHT0_9ROSI
MGLKSNALSIPMTPSLRLPLGDLPNSLSQIFSSRVSPLLLLRKPSLFWNGDWTECLTTAIKNTAITLT